MAPEAEANSPPPPPPPSGALAAKELDTAAGSKGGPELKVTLHSRLRPGSEATGRAISPSPAWGDAPLRAPPGVWPSLPCLAWLSVGAAAGVAKAGVILRSGGCRSEGGGSGGFRGSKGGKVGDGALGTGSGSSLVSCRGGGSSGRRLGGSPWPRWLASSRLRIRGTGVPGGFRHLDGAGSRVPTGGGGGVETAAAAASSEGGVTGEGRSKVRGRGEGEAWGSGGTGGTRSPGGAELPGNQTPSPRARRMAGEEGVTSGSTRDVRRESEERSEACSFREPPPADGSDCTFPISDGGRVLWQKNFHQSTCQGCGDPKRLPVFGSIRPHRPPPLPSKIHSGTTSL